LISVLVFVEGLNLCLPLAPPLGHCWALMHEISATIFVGPSTKSILRVPDEGLSFGLTFLFTQSKLCVFKACLSYVEQTRFLYE